MSRGGYNEVYWSVVTLPFQVRHFYNAVIPIIPILFHENQYQVTSI